MEIAPEHLLDTAPCGFVSFTDEGRIVYMNTTLAQRLGYARSDLAGQQFEKILSVGGRIFHQTHFFPLLKLHGKAQEVFLLLRASDGSDVGVLCNAVRRPRADTQVTDCVLMEVHERRKFEGALLKAREDLNEMNRDLEKQRAAAEDANRAKSTFLAVMSHELRTPLNAIGGYVQLLDMGVHGPVTQAQSETLARIDRSQRHLLRLINDVLNLSRIEAGRVDYRIEDVVMATVIAATVPMIEPQAAAKNLRIERTVPAGTHASGDLEKVQQILINLLNNALKFTDPGGSIHISTGNLPDSRVFLSVTDTGAGIPANMLDRIFEPFVQVDSSHSRAAEGTGLGLAISRDLARGMGGNLTAESTPGKGSTFTLTLKAA